RVQARFLRDPLLRQCDQPVEPAGRNGRPSLDERDARRSGVLEGTREDLVRTHPRGVPTCRDIALLDDGSTYTGTPAATYAAAAPRASARGPLIIRSPGDGSRSHDGFVLEARCVGVDDVVRRPDQRDASPLHQQDTVTEARHRAQVVRDEDDRLADRPKALER